MHININPTNPLLYRHWKFRKTSFGTYLHQWSTAFNEQIFPLDFLPTHPMAHKSYHDLVDGMVLRRGSKGTLKIVKSPC